MRRKYKNKTKSIAVVILLGIAFGFLVSYVLMFLWNYTIAAIFDVKHITMWQALGLFLLCKILFGFGKGGRGGGPPWMKRSLGEKFGGLNEEEKEKMKSYMQRKWCSWEDSTEEPVRDNGSDRKTV